MLKCEKGCICKYTNKKCVSDPSLCTTMHTKALERVRTECNRLMCNAECMCKNGACRYAYFDAMSTAELYQVAVELSKLEQSDVRAEERRELPNESLIDLESLLNDNV